MPTYVSSQTRYLMLREAINNDYLEGEVCPSCLAVVLLKRFDCSKATTAELQDELARLENALNESALRRWEPTDREGAFVEYSCPKCRRSFVGETLSCGGAAGCKSTVAYHFERTDTRIEDIRNMAVVDLEDESRLSAVTSHWERERLSRIDTQDPEDGITGQLRCCIEDFFRDWTRDVFGDSDTIVRAYPRIHAGGIESHGRNRLPASGADLAIWLGILSEDDAIKIDQVVTEVRGGLGPASWLDEIPDRVGNGVLLQAKMSEGALKKQQTQNLVRYGALRYLDQSLPGNDGKLFLEYLTAKPFVTWLSPAFTTALVKDTSSSSGHGATSFLAAKRKYAALAEASSMSAFLTGYIVGRVGTPLLSLGWILGSGAREAIIVGRPPRPHGGGGGGPSITTERRHPLRASLTERIQYLRHSVHQRTACHWRSADLLALLQGLEPHVGHMQSHFPAQHRDDSQSRGMSSGGHSPQ